MAKIKGNYTEITQVESSHVQDKHLTLPRGRMLAYADNGNPSSSIVVLCFHAAFHVGKAARIPRVLKEKNVHYLCPTLPGWGRSSPLPASTYAASLVSDINTLLVHLHPNDANLKLYLSGSAFGTVAAQILYGASYEAFPMGRYIAGLLLIAPVAPLRYYKPQLNNKSMLTQFILKVMLHLKRRDLLNNMGTMKKGQAYFRQIFSKMGKDERELLKEWRNERGLTGGALEKELAQTFLDSIAVTWKGFMGIPDVLFSDWGFCPIELDKEHAQPVLVVAKDVDEQQTTAVAAWVYANYRNAQFRARAGIHNTFLIMDEIWAEFLKDE